MVELDWLLMNYEVARVNHLPLVLLHGAECPELARPGIPPNLTAARVVPPNPFGTHHTKVILSQP